MKYDLAVFDLDGTILNTLDDLADSVNAVLQIFGYPVHTTEEIRFFVGNGVPKLIERALPENVTESQRKQVFEEFVKYYDAHSAVKTRPYDKMPDTLKILKASGVKLAVNSNKLHQASVDLCNKYFPGIFDCVSGNREGFAVKPSSDGVHFIMKELGFTSKDLSKIVYIGDSDVDVATAKNSGIDFIGCQWGFRGKEFLIKNGAEITISSPDKLIDLF